MIRKTYISSYSCIFLHVRTYSYISQWGKKKKNSE